MPSKGARGIKMKLSIRSAAIILAAASVMAGATFCCISDSELTPLIEEIYAEENNTEEMTGTEDILSFDAEPSLKLAGEDEAAPEDAEPSEEDDPESPINNWPGIKESNTSEVAFLRNDKGNKFEYRKLAKQKMFGYDTFQGTCAYGKYSYHILYNRIKEKCKIIKVSLKTNKVVKISKALALDHGNDMTYDPVRKRLVVVHYGSHVRRISCVDPKTLKIISYTDIETPKKRLPGASTAFSKSISGVTGIAYDESRDEFIASIKGARHYLVLNSDFEPQSVIKVPKNDPYVKQGMTVIDGYIIRAFSAYNKTYNQNILYVYDYNGNFVKTVKLGSGYEIESLYFSGDKLYASTYTSYFKKITKTVKKKVKVVKNGKVKKVKKKLKVTKYVLRRDNNVINIAEY